MFYNGKAQAGTAFSPRPVLIHTVEPFKQAGDMLFFNSNAVIGNFDQVVLTNA
jgi:hypothetical protein